MKTLLKRASAVLLAVMLITATLTPFTLAADDLNGHEYSYEAILDDVAQENEMASEVIPPDDVADSVEVEDYNDFSTDNAETEGGMENPDGVIKVFLTSAIDGSPFFVIFDPETGRVSMYSLDGNPMGHRYVLDEAAFWELVDTNRASTEMSLEQRMGRARMERSLNVDYNEVPEVNVEDFVAIAPLFDTGTSSVFVPRADNPWPDSAVSTLVSGNYFNTSSLNRRVELQTYALPASMPAIDVLFINAFGDDWTFVWDMTANRVEGFSISWPTEPYGAWVSSYRGSGTVPLRFFAHNGTVSPSPIQPPATSATVTFNANGGTVNQASITVPIGQQIGSLPTPTRNRWGFVGWFNTSASTGGTQFHPTTVINADVTLFARWALIQTGSRTFNSSGSMSLLNLPVGQSRTSNELQFNVSGLPSNATITSITVNPGTSSAMGGHAGIIVGNFMQIRRGTAPTGTTQVSWNGGSAINATDSTFFVGFPANGTYFVSWNGTATSGSLPSLLQPSNNMATRGFSNVRITINYEFW